MPRCMHPIVFVNPGDHKSLTASHLSRCAANSSHILDYTIFCRFIFNIKIVYYSVTKDNKFYIKNGYDKKKITKFFVRKISYKAMSM